VALAGAGLAAHGTAVESAAAAHGDAWPMQRFDYGNTGYHPGGNDPTSLVLLTELQEFSPVIGEDYLFADGTVYVHDGETAEVTAVDLETGERRWTNSPTDARFIPEFVEGPLLVGRTIGGRLFALNRESGEVTVEIETDRGFGLGFGGSGEWFAPTMDGPVIAGQENADEFRWVGDTSGVGFRPAVDDERVYVATLEGVPEADLNLESPSRMDATGHLYALDRSDGSVVWDVSRDGFGVRSVAVADGRVYWPAADGTLTAYDAASGDREWQFEGMEGFNSEVAVAEGVVFAGNDDGRVYGVDAESGEEVGQIGIGERVRGAPVVVDNTVYFGTEQNFAYAYSLDIGEIVWEFETAGRVRGITVANDRVVVGTTESTLVLQPADGSSDDGGDTGGGGSSGGGDIVTGGDTSGGGSSGSNGGSGESRGFLTNDPDSGLAFLNDPVSLTWAGIVVSIVGIVMQLLGEQT